MKILLATDGSEYSEIAAKILTCLKLSAEDEITVFHAMYFIPCLYGQESYRDTLKSMKQEIAPKIIDSALDILKPVKAKISTLLLEGTPEYSITDVADECDIDLIVMGAKGKKESDSLFIGSVAKSVTINSSKPVLVTKPPVSKKSDNMKILFATDGSRHSSATKEILSGIPFPDRTEITVLNIIPWEFLDIPRTFVPELDEGVNHVIEKTGSKRLLESKKILEQAKEYLNNTFQNVNVILQVGDPSKEIIKASEKLGADLVAVGCRGLRGIKGMFGSVSKNILADSKCSVLIGKTCKE